MGKCHWCGKEGPVIKIMIEGENYPFCSSECAQNKVEDVFEDALKEFGFDKDE